ncbi:DUF2062 domain-containing protein [Pacificibacter maritimus]|uniref:DUF2062 domain-containing protein n=1 Tax=Pacificibacter maritimus TaxID=762213 RepID=UPI00319EBAF7
MPLIKWVQQSVWPRGGWSRAVRYMKLRLNRLPGTPDSIARGVFAGVFTAFSPFFGLHFVVAALVAKVVRGNVLAALLATFAGNPLTYVPIAIISLQTGHAILGSEFDSHNQRSVVGKFYDAGHDLIYNITALFSSGTPNWESVLRFGQEVFYPYLVGGLIPGVLAGLVAYFVSLPMITAYQKRRRGRLKSKFEELRRKAGALASKNKSR